MVVESSAVLNDQSNDINTNQSHEESDKLLIEEVKGDSKIDDSTSKTVDDSTVALDNTNETISKISENHEIQTDNAQNDKPKYRVDAEEFVPRAYRQNYEPLPVPNFIPLPIIGDVYPHNFPNPAFMPPINFIPGVQYEKFVPNFIPNQYFINQEQFYMRNHIQQTEIEEKEDTEENDEEKEVLNEKPTQNSIDIAKIVNKLEEAAMEQKMEPKNIKNKKTDNISPRNYEKQNKQNKKITKTEIETKNVPIPDETKTKQTETPKNEPVVPTVITETPKPKPEITKPEVKEIKIESPKKVEPTFSKMLKSSISLIENKSSDFKPLYKKQNSYNGNKTTTSPTTKNYSETLKKTYKKETPKYEKKFTENKLKTEPKVEIKKPVTPDSWISVSSRKKRKNKGVSEVESFEFPDEIENTEMNGHINDIEPSIEVCVAEIEKTYELQAQQRTITEVEVEKINKVEEEHVEIKIGPVEVAEKKIETELEAKVDEIIEKVAIEKVEPKNENKLKKSKKVEKPKKITTKNKRIIINDQELQKNNNTNNTETKNTKLEGKLEVSLPLETKKEKSPQIKVQIPPVEKSNKPVALETEKIPVETVTERQESVEELEEQKTETKIKKKKRKTKPKTQSSPSTTSTDESYEFLIEPETKTNLEVSLELDRMIQRGLYANLEEKLKSFNPSDSFISSVEKEDFNIDLKTLENNAFKNFDKLKNIDFGQVFFNTTTNKTFEKVINNKNEQVLKKTTEETNEEVKKFPITKAVKEWMDKTRENTPEIEILKSVNEIRNEYLICHDIDSDSENEEFPKNAEGLPVPVTLANNIISTRESSKESTPDLLECWESDIDIKNYQYDLKKVPEIIETGEDVLEIYESVYGKNEDFLRIQKEINENNENRSLNYPKNGSLPYRAICCNVM